MKPRNRKFHNGRFAMLHSELIESKSFQDLSGKEMWVLVRFYQKIKRNPRIKMRAELRISDILNNGQIVFTYAEAKEHGISESTFARTLRKFVELGFIDIATQGNTFTDTPTSFAISRVCFSFVLIPNSFATEWSFASSFMGKFLEPSEAFMNVFATWIAWPT